MPYQPDGSFKWGGRGGPPARAGGVGRSTATESHGRAEDLSFWDAVEPFIRACPGPAPAVKALRLVAYQAIRGIPGLEPEDSAHSGPSKNHDGGKSSPIRTLKDVADVVSYTADHLAKEAKRFGYSISSCRGTPSANKERVKSGSRAGWGSRMLRPGAGSSRTLPERLPLSCRACS